MIRYKTEIMKTSFKLVTSSINEKEMEELNDLITKRQSEGWELVTYSFMGGGGGSDFGRGILITFKKD
jgi:MoaA/NifB/PqqE/SkfB family radical SAM enzyme